MGGSAGRWKAEFTMKIYGFLREWCQREESPLLMVFYRVGDETLEFVPEKRKEREEGPLDSQMSGHQVPRQRVPPGIGG